MTTSVLTLAGFLLARIAEDEEAARRADDECAQLDQDFEVEDSGNWRRWSRPFASVTSTGPVAEFVNRQTPARVLAECDAKRRIVEVLGDYSDGYVWASGESSRAEDALRALTLPYADHPDYRDEWRP